MGNQSPDTGSAYAGLISYGLGSYIEYMQGHLTNMLPGQHYRVSMKVSLAETASTAGSTGVGILFSVDSIGRPFGYDSLLLYTPQVDYSAYGPVSNITSWVTLADTFQADSAYKFITIGRFQPHSQVVTDSVSPGPRTSYYYIDDVTVVPVTVGVASYFTSEISIAPNPLVSTASLSFVNPAKEPYTFTLYNIQGQPAQTQGDIRSEQFTINRNDLPPGLYFFRLGSSTRQYAGKLLVE
jgi:hypothetical protein